MHERTLNLCQAVRRRRRELDLTQIELAELAECSTRFVHMVENGKVSVRLDKLLDLLTALGLELRIARGKQGLRDDSGPSAKAVT